MQRNFMPSSGAPVADAGPSARQPALLLQSVPVRRGFQLVVGAARVSNPGLLVLALLVGAGAGGGAIIFRWLIKAFTVALSGHSD